MPATYWRSIAGLKTDKQRREARELVKALGLTEEEACQMPRFQLQALVRQRGITRLTQGALVFINTDQPGAQLRPVRPAQPHGTSAWADPGPSGPLSVEKVPRGALPATPDRDFLREAHEAARAAATPDSRVVGQADDHRGWRDWPVWPWNWSRNR